MPIILAKGDLKQYHIFFFKYFSVKCTKICILKHVIVYRCKDNQCIFSAYFFIFCF